MKKIELLAPAGNLDKLKIAILYGADAIYIGGETFSLRARASNFSLEDIRQASAFAHQHHTKLYVTMNIIPHNEDFKGLETYLLFLESVGVDAIITSSMHIMRTALSLTPQLEVHLSTQLSISNHYACLFFKEMGVNRIVLARETHLDQIKQIIDTTQMEIEVFIHGGMCSSYSGRCLLSNYYVNRDANRGGCAHSCRWNYRLYLDNQEVTQASFFHMGAKDLSAVDLIPNLIHMGVASLKIEGRMKSDYYIATVVRAYRQLIDDVYANRNINFAYYYEELKKAENRLTSTGFLKGNVTTEEQLYLRDEHPTKSYVGIVLDYDSKSHIVKIEQRNHFKPGDELEFFGPKLANTIDTVGDIWDESNTLVDAARHPKQILFFKTLVPVSKNDMIRLVKK